MQVILTQDLANVGQKGQLINVKPGFYRNFLDPRGYAVLATKNLIEKAKEINAQIEAEQKAREAGAKKNKETLESKALKISKKLTKKGSLYSKVSEKEIAEAIHTQFSFEISDSNIVIKEAIKTVGEHNVLARLTSSVTAVVKVLVEKENEEA